VVRAEPSPRRPAARIAAASRRVRRNDLPGAARPHSRYLGLRIFRHLGPILTAKRVMRDIATHVLRARSGVPRFPGILGYRGGRRFTAVLHS